MKKLCITVLAAIVIGTTAHAETPQPLSGWTEQQIEAGKQWAANHPGMGIRAMRDYWNADVQTGTVPATTRPRSNADIFRRQLLRLVYDAVLTGLTMQQLLDAATVAETIEAWLPGQSVNVRTMWSVRGALFWDEYQVFAANPQAWLAADDETVPVPARPIKEPRWKNQGLPRELTSQDVEALKQ